MDAHLYMAISLFRARKHDACIVSCERILSSQPGHEGAWVLLLQCQVEVAWVEEWAAEEALAEALSPRGETHSTSLRPGTSLRHSNAPRSSGRPTSVGGRPLSGVTRPLTAVSLRPSNATPAAPSSRSRGGPSPLTRPSASRGGAVLAVSTGPWVATHTLHEAARPSAAKAIFEYILLREGNALKAMELAREAAKGCLRGDIGWWEEQLGRCLLLCGRLRDSRVAIRASMGLPPGDDGQPDARLQRVRSLGREYRTRTLSGVLRLSRVDSCLDQPLAAISVCITALDAFPADVILLTEIARLYEALGDEEMSVKYYRDVLRNDSVNPEALACVATYHYYQEQPDMAIPFYRHLLQLGVCTVEVLCNLALCYLGTQQLDLVLPYFFKALSLTKVSGNHETLGQLWYNGSHIALCTGDVSLAIKCLELCLYSDSNNSQAHNNFAILELFSSESRDRVGSDMAAHLRMANSLTPNAFEPAYNMVMFVENMGDIQSSHALALRAIKAQPERPECNSLLDRLKKMLSI